MDCTLFIPHLLPPREGGEALWRMVDAPQLKTLLARATMTHDDSTDPHAALCGLLGVARQLDFPLAPLLARQRAIDSASGFWLCATPVHLETRRNALVLSDPAALAISAAESSAFATTLAEHLREENILLHAPQPGTWFLSDASTPTMTTSSLGSAIGRDVRTLLPQGKDSQRWHRILTEMQMLLHAHPLNDAREARGLPTVNSVWLWGGGTLPAPVPQPFATVWSDDFIAGALAQHAGCPQAPLPARIMPESLIDGAHLFTFEDPEKLWRQGDAQTWSSTVTALERDWFKPLVAGLGMRRPNALTLIACTHDGGTLKFAAHKSDLFKFWRKNKYLP